MDEPEPEGEESRVVIRVPGMRIPVRVKGTTFYVLPLTAALNEEVDADLRKRFPNADWTTAHRHREIGRRLLVGWDVLELLLPGEEGPKTIRFGPDCPLCRGTKVEGGGPGSGPCLPCGETGTMGEFLFRAFPDSLWDRLFLAAASPFNREVDRGKG